MFSDLYEHCSNFVKTNDKQFTIINKKKLATFSRLIIIQFDNYFLKKITENKEGHLTNKNQLHTKKCWKLRRLPTFPPVISYNFLI